MKKVLRVAAIKFNYLIAGLDLNVPVLDDKCAKFDTRACYSPGSNTRRLSCSASASFIHPVMPKIICNQKYLCNLKLKISSMNQKIYILFCLNYPKKYMHELKTLKIQQINIWINCILGIGGKIHPTSSIANAKITSSLCTYHVILGTLENIRPTEE
jgi:hypothetical protein